MTNPGRPANTPKVLWSKVKIGESNECWEWQAFRNHDGYGRTWIGNKGYYAHRVIYDLAYPGQITLEAPRDRSAYGYLMHTCDNPPCCNPAHLRVGTHTDNMQDKILKGRGPDFKGDKGPRCLLTMQEAEKARRLRKTGIPTRLLAQMFGLSNASMKSLIAGKTYCV